jgi:methylenetetrahydrofolate reductase (NADPH)
VEATAQLCARLVAEGVPVLHFYTLNRSTATTELVRMLDLAPATAAAAVPAASGSAG